MKKYCPARLGRHIQYSIIIVFNFISHSSKINTWDTSRHVILLYPCQPITSKYFLWPYLHRKQNTFTIYCTNQLMCVFLCALCVQCMCGCISHLAQNPFICDCHLKWLADYLQDNPIETSGARCTSPRRLANKRIGQIKSKKFRCSGINPHAHITAYAHTVAHTESQFRCAQRPKCQG